MLKDEAKNSYPYFSLNNFQYFPNILEKVGNILTGP